MVRAAGVMGGLTLVSRVLGMIRDVVCARAFGTTWQWDAFVYAFMVPNFFRRLVGEGALSSAFIPVYSEVLSKKGKQEAFRFANTVLTVLAVGFLVFLLAAESVLGWGLSAGIMKPRLALVFDFLRFFFPYLALMSIYALGMGILNSHKHFFAPALGPVLLNVIWIGAVLWLSAQPFENQIEQLRILAVFIVGAGALHIAAEVPELIKIGYKPLWVWDLFSPELLKTARLLGPIVLGFAVMQINLLVDMTLSFWVGPGANSSLWYGNRLMQLPLGVFAIAMGTVLLPEISRQVAAGKKEEASSNLSFALRGIFFIVLPCAAGLIILSTPIVRFLFERGEFDAESTRRTAAVLLCYSIGLFAYSGQKIITSGFYAVQDTRTPVKIAVIALLTNLIFNLLLMGPMGEAGLALATSISGILQFLLLMFFFNKRHLSFSLTRVTAAFLKIFSASALMAAGVFFIHAQASVLWPGDETLLQGFRVIGSIIAGGIFYLALCLLFRVGEAGSLFKKMTRHA